MSTLEGMTPGTWTLDPAHTEVGFSVRHAGISKVRGVFSDVSGELNVTDDSANNTGLVTIQTNSVDTKNEGRDNHVRSAEFFDVENYPQMTYKITGVELNGDEGTVKGQLTLRDVTKDVDLAVEFNGVAVDPFGATRAGFSASTSISRKEFNVTWNAALETGGVMVSDKVNITLDVEFTAPESSSN
ncbi:MAG: YceI family protein [Kocuria sp.]|uniref:YceI family protein n=1 Tax=Kocuria salsicia TaxID=664639 RepID=A0ABV3KH92_9MICC|nr:MULTISPECIES: YceI family protein [Kocuria]MBS6030709.1 YceI family protein [Kocuria rhizophila]WNB88169.1 YceI family protein [Glutamicibacter protophormiae]MDN5630914.1 YceI family protein [Kocuria sp.]MDO4257298.1 YceI family protein [Kocuria sp.]RUP84080.1 polyisoprenoid-binding protein [Kocuria sp. HSID17590]